MPQYENTKLYPSQQNFQYVDQGEVPLVQVVAYFSEITKGKGNVRVRNLNKLELWYDKELSDMEVLTNKYMFLLNSLKLGQVGGLTPEQVAKILSNV